MHHTPDPIMQHLIPHVTTLTVADDPQSVTSHVNESPPCPPSQSYRKSDIKNVRTKVYACVLDIDDEIPKASNSKFKKKS